MKASVVITITAVSLLLGAPAPSSAEFRGQRETRSDSVAYLSHSILTQSGHAVLKDLKFTHLTTNDGLSQGYVTAIVQDRRGFMWFATRDGLNRYDGNAFVVYKNNPSNPATLSSNFIQDLLEDDHGYLWIATNNGVNKFDPTTERCNRYVHDPKDPNSLGSAYVTSIARDNRGYLWVATLESGLDKLDPATGIFTHYRNDEHGQFVGRLTKVIAGRQGEIWFVGQRGLFHLDQSTGQISHPPATRNGLSAESVYQDEVGNLWLLADSPIVGLVKYDPQAERVTNYPLPPRVAGVPASTMNGGSVNGNLVADGQDGFWVPSSLGLSYFDRRTQRFPYRFQHDDTNPNSLDSNAILSVYRDKGGVLWVGTENSGLNVLDFRQEQFVRYRHHPDDPNSISPGRVKAIYREPDGVLWVGFFPRALDRLDQKTGQIRHYIPKPGGEITLHPGTNVDSIYKDAASDLWIGGGDGGLDRFDQRSGRVKHYGHNPDDPNSLISDNVLAIYGDRNGRMWVGQQYGLSRLDPATDGFANYRPDPNTPDSSANWVEAIYQDRSGMLWLGTFRGSLIRFDEKTKTFVGYPPDSHDPHRLNGGGVTTIHEDRNGTLWVGTFGGLYRLNRENETFTHYTETEGLPSSTIRCILEDKVGRLWLSTQRGISRFDPQTETFRNYDVSDGLQTNEFSDGCYASSDGEMFFGGSNGFNTFFPENIHENPYIPPIVITSFRIFNQPVPIAAESLLKKAIPYVDSLTLSYRDNIFSFEFAALSYANSQKNRYQYKLDGFDPGWNDVGSKQRLATYTNLDPGRYVFRVRGSNSDGVWNEEGVSLPILITPPWWRTNVFRALCAAITLAILWAVYNLRVRQLQREFNMTIEARVSERTRIARELHDTLLQSLQALLFQYQAARNLFAGGSERAMKVLDATIDRTEQAIAEGRDAIQDIRSDRVAETALPELLTMAGSELAESQADRALPTFGVTVEGERRTVTPIIREETYRIGLELLRNAFRHAKARRIEAEIRYDADVLRVRIRDDGKGMDPRVLQQGRDGHWGLRGVRERAQRMGAKLDVWSEAGAGTEFQLTVPARSAYIGPGNGLPSRVFRKLKTYAYRK